MSTVVVAVVCLVVIVAGVVRLAFLRRRGARAARRGGLLEFDTPEARAAVVSWFCMICGRTRPDAYIAVASRTAGWLTINVRYCADSDSCREAAEAKADDDVRRFGPGG